MSAGLGAGPASYPPEPQKFRQVLGHFCTGVTVITAIDVLTQGQHHLAGTFGRSGTSKFAGVRWSPDGAGSPVLDGVLTWAGCEVEAVYPGGDHTIVIGRVRELGECGDQLPLLFYRGRYATLAESAGPPEIVGTLLAWPRYADWM